MFFTYYAVIYIPISILCYTWVLACSSDRKHARDSRKQKSLGQLHFPSKHDILSRNRLRHFPRAFPVRVSVVSRIRIIHRQRTLIQLQRQLTFQITFALHGLKTHWVIHKRSGDFAKFTAQILYFSLSLVVFIIIWQAAIHTHGELTDSNLLACGVFCRDSRFANHRFTDFYFANHKHISIRKLQISIL